MNEGQLTEGGKNHEKTFTKRGGNLAVVELTHTRVVALSKVKPDLFPSLTHGCVKGMGV
jgi:hypothetical protein